MRYFSVLISLMVSLSVMAAPKSNHKEFAAKGNTTIKVLTRPMCITILQRLPDLKRLMLTA